MGRGNNNSDAVNEHHLFLLGGGGNDNGDDDEGMTGTGRNARRQRRGNGLRLLSMEEVETLPTIEYTSCSSSAVSYTHLTLPTTPYV